MINTNARREVETKAALPTDSPDLLTEQILRSGTDSKKILNNAVILAYLYC
jgi:hypothetical protein